MGYIPKSELYSYCHENLDTGTLEEKVHYEQLFVRDHKDRRGLLQKLQTLENCTLPLPGCAQAI